MQAEDALKDQRQGLLLAVLRVLIRARLRGSTRITLGLAKRMRSLQALPVRLDDGTHLFADLRISSCHALFARMARKK